MTVVCTWHGCLLMVVDENKKAMVETSTVTSTEGVILHRNRPKQRQDA